MFVINFKVLVIEYKIDIGTRLINALSASRITKDYKKYM